MRLAKRVATLSPSATLAITARAKELKDSGVDIIGLGAGEPDFNTPKFIIDAAYQSMLEGKTKYTPAAGLPELKDAIIAKLKRDQDLSYSRPEIMIGCGAKHVLYLLFQALLDKDDEVLIPAPYWVSYPEQVKLAEGVPVFIEGSETANFKVTAEQVEAAITEKTKAIIINSPNNPTGMVYSKAELQAIGEVCLKHHVIVISDEIYEKLIYGDVEHYSIARFSPEFKENTIIVNGVSKSHSMTGWRIGYVAGNKELITAMTNLASHSTSNPTTSAQYATIAAYNGGQESIEDMRQAFEKRLEVAYQQLIQIPGLTCIKPQGAFYFFVNVAEATKNCGFASVDEFSSALLNEAKVAVVPGKDFGAANCIRLSYATSIENLENAIARIKDYVESKSK